MANILILEDNISLSKVIEIIAKKMGHVVKAYISPFDAISDNAIESADLIISDYEMAPGTALDLFKYMKENNLYNKVVMNTGYHNAKTEIEENGYLPFVKGWMNKMSSREETEDYIDYFLNK